MDLKQLTYFIAVAEECNITRAALRLHIAQPPLSRHIHAIEQALGVALFTRTGRGLELTDAGRTLLAEAPHILSMMRSAEDKTRRAGLGLTGLLDIGLFGSGVLTVIPQLLASFHQQRPAVQLNLHNLTKVEQLQALRERRLSVGFNRLVPDEPDIAVETILREGYLVALPQTHRLAQRATLSLRDLQGEPLILYPKQALPGLAQEILDAIQHDGWRAHISQTVEDFVTAIALVAGGFGVCITVESAANLRLPGVVYLPLHDARLQDIALACLYRRDDRSPLLAAFLEHVREQARRFAPPGQAQAAVPRPAP